MRDPEELLRMIAAVELSRLPGVGAKTFKDLVIEHGTPERALDARRRTLDRTQGAGKAPLDEETLDALAHLRSDVGFTAFGDFDYPPRLGEIPEPPPYLFHEGPLWPLKGRAVTIVGPRRCTPRGAVFARELASKLASKGVSVVSGGALGVDAAAHQGALSQDGSTVLVKANGIDRVYPRDNARLQTRIARDGCVLTELLPGAPPRRDFFPTRNRIMVALGDAVVVVEGQLDSGTATSAARALALGRPLLTWPGSAEPRLRALPERLIERGAVPLEGPDAETVIAEIPG